MSSPPSHAGEELPTAVNIVSQITIRSLPTGATSSQAPLLDKTNPTERASRLMNLAASATDEDKRNTDDAMTVEAAAMTAQAGSNLLDAKAEEIHRKAKTRKKQAAGENIHVLVSENLSHIRHIQKQMANAASWPKTVAKTARKLEEEISTLQLAVEDPRVSVRSQQECLEEIGEAAADLGALGARSSSNPAPNLQDLLTMQRAELDTETDDLEILEDTPEIRALFEKKAEKDGTARARTEPQDSLNVLSAERDLQAEQQIQGELQASAALFHTQNRLEQERKLKAARALSQQLSKYRPTARDTALGLKWTLSSSEIVRDDLEREIQEGGSQPYVAGHIAVMHRKLAILCLFAQEHEAPSSAIVDEVGALGNALFKAKPLVNAASVRNAADHLRRNDHRNSLYKTFGFERPKLVNLVPSQPNRKRKRVNYSTDPETGGLKQDAIPLRVKRLRMVEPRSHVQETQHVTCRRPGTQAATLGQTLDKP